MDPIRVGNIVIHPLLDGVARLPTAVFAGSDWSNHQEFVDPEDGKVHVPVGAFVFESAGRTVLIDAGVGEIHTEMFDGGALIESLATLGKQPADVDVVFVSHLHSDHMGWLVRDGQSVFAQAEIFVGEADWNFFVVADRGGAGRLRAVESQVTMLGNGETTIVPGFTSRATPGHTPGHNCAVLSSGTERLLVLGDAIHCPAQLTETEWEVMFDADRDLALRTRNELIREAEAPDVRLLPMHFPGMQAARLLPGEGTRRWVVGS